MVLVKVLVEVLVEVLVKVLVEVLVEVLFFYHSTSASQNIDVGVRWPSCDHGSSVAV